MNPPRPTPSEPLARPLSVELAQLRDTFKERPVTLREITAALASRGWELLIILCVLPVLLPVTLLGMSLIFGVVVVVVSAQLALGRLPWLPRWLLDRQFPPGFLAKVLGATCGLVAALERVLRPRALAITGTKWLNRFHLSVVCVAGLLMAQPLPIPFTHKLPAITILLLVAGLIERDGLMILSGYAMLLVSALWFYLVGAAIDETLTHTWHWLFN